MELNLNLLNEKFKEILLIVIFNLIKMFTLSV
jgi:hypothetical protein